MIYRIIQWWATIFLRVYFRRTIVYGLEHIPPDGPLIVASNHPSSFFEASLLGTVIRRPLHYLVRGDVFHPRFRWLFNWTNQIPIYRQKDGISNLRKNASSFDLTYRKLAEGHAVLIFPEAKTLLEKKLRPVQRGTAHLAFGTLPLMEEGSSLPVLPVGVNFTEPRIPGTDVVVRFGAPFTTEKATRDDREAIERFTETLTEAMHPLVIAIHDHGYERHYDVLASVYLTAVRKHRPTGLVHDDLMAVAATINESAGHDPLIRQVHDHIHVCTRHKIRDTIYFPGLLAASKGLLFFLLCFKVLWWMSGGWIWRVMRSVIFNKIKAITFQGPVSLGAAMVVFPLISVVMAIVLVALGVPVWGVLLWWLTLWLGVFSRPPVELIWKVFVLPFKVHAGLRKNVRVFGQYMTERLGVNV